MSFRIRHYLMLGSLLALACAASTGAEEPNKKGVSPNSENWGHLSGRFVFDGRPPAPVRLNISKDEDAFGKVFSESLVVNRRNRGLANVVIYLMPKPGEKAIEHPSYAKAAKKKIRLEMRDGRFKPHVLLLRTSQTLFQNCCDKVAHNANISFQRNAPM